MFDRLIAAGLVDAIPDGLVVVDAVGTMVYANSRIAELSGYDPSELVGRSVETLLPEADRSRHARHRADHASSGHPTREMGVDLDTRLLREDGTSLPVDIALSGLGTGEETLVVATVRDATARLTAEAAHHELHRRLSELIENVELLVVGLDAQGRVFYANPHLSAMTGYAPEEMIGTDWFSSFIADQDQEEVRRVFRQVMADGEAHAYHESRLRSRGRRAPTIGWFNIRLLDPDGSLAGSLSIGEDLTARRRSEERLRAVSRVRQAILTANGAPEAVFRLIAAEARSLTDADLAVVVSPLQDRYVARGVAGATGAGLEGADLPTAAWRESAALRQAAVFDSISPLLPAGFGEYLGPCLVVPSARTETQGVVMVSRKVGADHFDDDDVLTLEQLSEMATVATQYRQTQQRLRELAVLEDRERIAREMHDVVIQRLFAAGLSVNAVLAEVQDRPPVVERLEHVVESLDEAIRELRGSIFSLRAHRRGGLYDQVLDLVGQWSDTLGFAPEVTVQIPGDTLPEQVGEHLLATLREALTNVARHAYAGQAAIDVRARGSDLVLVVEDDGRGLPDDISQGMGLNNMAERARRLGGELAVGDSDMGGVRVEWRVPVRP